MEVKDNTLSHNIKFLRKTKNISQEELALQLGIKRSNIAAYESKNVEPRLRIILEIARLFDVSVKSLIEGKMESGIPLPSFDADALNTAATPKKIDLKDEVHVEQFVSKSIKIKKVLEGFKAFYTFKKNNLKENSPERERLIFDIDNFVQLMEHLLAYNETVIKAISNKQNTQPG
jgi:transcriptional regulator with XRE-family HTH domain